MFKKKKKDTVDEQQDSQSRKSGIKIGKVAGGVIAFFLAGYLLVGSIYSLKENEYAVITTFGVPGVVEESGIHVKLPYIQRLAKVPKTINGFPIGYESETGNFVDKESFMITRDYNFVNVDFYVEYRVTDPVKYLFASEDPISILKNLTQSYIRDTIGLYDVDSVITTGKNEKHTFISFSLRAVFRKDFFSRRSLSSTGTYPSRLRGAMRAPIPMRLRPS